MIKPLILSAACIIGAFSLHFSSDYMQSKEMMVTLVDRHLEESCHKSRCHDRFIGLFKTEDGRFFDKEINLYTYKQMHLGEKFTISIRRFDIKQTPWENVFFFFLPCILLSVGISIPISLLLVRNL